MKLFSQSFILLSALLLAACSTNPVTGKSELSLMSAAQEVAIGEKNYEPYQQQQGGSYVVDPELSLYVKEVGLKLAKVSNRPKLPYDFVVLNSSVPNAWALPGGKIAINRGLLVLLDDEAQLAAVLGHEVVHAAARHTAQQMTRQQILGVGVAVAGIAAASRDYGQLVGLGLIGGAALYQAHYGRSQELQADRYGIEYMVKAGYEPQAAVELQQTFVRLSEGKNADFFSALFASHPPSQQRVDKNRELAANLPAGKRNRARYQAAIAQIKKDEPAYQKQIEALQAMAKDDFAGATKAIKKAIALQPDEALFHITAGQMYFQQKDYKAAYASFSAAARVNPDYFMSPLGLGLAQKALEKDSEAEQNLKKSLLLLPTPIAVYSLGELAEKAGKRSEAIGYYRQVAGVGGEIGEAATARLNKLSQP